MKKFSRLLVDNLCVNADGGPIYGTKYDMANACKYCGTGAEPIGSRFMSKLKKNRKGIFEAGFGEILIDIELSKKFQEKGINSLAEVYKPKSKEKWSFMEIRGEAVLPPFSKKTTGYEIDLKRQCPYCKRDGYGEFPKKSWNLVYENLDSGLLTKNILITYERFGYSRLRKPFNDSVFARSLYIVSEKVVDILREERIKGVEFEPVIILNSE